LWRGAYTEWLLAEGAQLIAIDCSANMVELTRWRPATGRPCGCPATRFSSVSVRARLAVEGLLMNDQLYAKPKRPHSLTRSVVSLLLLTATSVLFLLHDRAVGITEPPPSTHVVAGESGSNSAAFPLPTAGPPALVGTREDVNSSWQFTCVDCRRAFLFRTDNLQLDSGGHLHFVYAYSYLHYLWQDSQGWHQLVLDNGIDSYNDPSLALDESGRPHVSYSSGGVLKYAYLEEPAAGAGVDQSGWHVETVQTPGEGWHPSLALDSDGWPHITFVDGAYGGNLVYAWRDEAGWHSETVDATGMAVRHNDLALDASDRPHVTYYTYAGGGRTLYARRDGSDWLIETVEAVYGWDASISLALDPDSHPHIVYYDIYSRSLHYAWHDGSTWSIETVGTASVFMSLALNPTTRQPHIAYSNNDDYLLHYVWRDGMGWHTATVESDCSHSALALDKDGEPHIVYDVWSSDSELKHAWKDNAGWHTELLDSAFTGGRAPALVLDTGDNPYVAYFSTRALKFAWLDGKEWRSEAVDGMDDGRNTALALDPMGQPHILYVARGPANLLKYAWRDGSGWQTEDLNIFGEDIALAVDALGRRHIAFDFELRYGFREGDSWYFETVDENGADISLALDGLGQPHIAYRYRVGSSMDESVKYAWRDGGGWHIETVDSEQEVGLYTSLVLDDSGRPHIAYCDYHYDGIARDLPCDLLKYARRDANGWYVETVDLGGRNASLGRGDLGQLQLIYRGADGTFKYARLAGKSWQIEQIVDVDQLYWFNSFAVDRLGRPRIAYVDRNDSIKYGRKALALFKSAVPAESLEAAAVLTYTLTFGGTGNTLRLVDPLPDELEFVPATIVDTITPTAAYSPSTRAVIWQGVLLSDTVGSIRFQVTPDITRTRLLSTPVPITNTVYLTDVRTGASERAMATVQLQPIPVSVSKRAEPTQGLQRNGIVTYTLTVDGPNRTVRLWDPLPTNVSYVAGSVTPPAVYSPTARGVFWSGSLPTDTATVIRFSVTPRMTGTGSLSLSQPVVNTVWVTETESGNVISATVIVNGWQLYLPLIGK
jgi:hypothetical protein